MAFFQRNFHNHDSSFSPLFRLLDDFDNYSRHGSHHHGIRRAAVPQWQPKFDIRETEDAYELYGELPGMNKSDVHIEFSDAQTMLVSGKVERSYHTATTPTAGHLEGSTTATITEAGEEAKSAPRQASVEEVAEEGAPLNTTSHSGGEVATTTQQPPADTAKYWLTERSIGEFARHFNFPTRVDQDGVTAKFKDGILNVVVPKAAKHEPRRISVL